MNDRDAYFDNIKGLAILAVVSVHFIGFRTDDVCLYLVRQLVSIAVFVFVFLAGYFVNVERLDGGACRFLRNRCWRLLVPYLFWTLLMTAIYSPKSFLSIGYFVGHHLLLGYGVTIGYYVIVLMQLTILAPCLVKCLRMSVVATLTVAGFMTLVSALISTLAATGLVSTFGLSVPVPFPGIFFTMWVFPYLMGLAIRLHKDRIMRRMPGHLLTRLIIFTVSFAMVIAEDLLGRRLGICTRAQFNFCGIVFASLCCWMIITNRCVVGAGVVAVIGRGSFLIYLTHIKLFGILRHILPAWFGFAGGGLNFIQYCLSLTIVACVYYVAIRVGERFLPVRFRRILAIS